jgi:hypothetical protein
MVVTLRRISLAIEERCKVEDVKRRRKAARNKQTPGANWQDL